MLETSSKVSVSLITLTLSIYWEFYFLDRDKDLELQVIKMIKNEDLNEISQIVGLDDKANKMKKNGKMKSTILDRLSSNNDSLPYP